MVDTGCGALFGPKCGKVPTILAELGVAPAAISTLFMTHLHGDHCGGALDQGRIVYPNARVILHPNKIAHWQVKDTPAGRFLITYADQIAAITDETPNGLSPWFLPSHTPGPMGLRMESNLALVGDIFHSAPFELADPNILPALTPIPSAPAAKWP